MSNSTRTEEAEAMCAMETIEAIAARRSIRVYEPTSIPREDLHAILEAARLAPSASNRQPYHFVVVREPALKRRLAGACNSQDWMAPADCIIAAVGIPSLTQKWYGVDTAIALENLVIAAAALGYGTCWIGSFQEDQVKELLGVPADLRVVALTPLGVPAEHPGPRGRKTWPQLFSLDRYGQKPDL